MHVRLNLKLIISLIPILFLVFLFPIAHASSTFGKTTSDNNTFTTLVGAISGTLFTLPEDGHVTQMTALIYSLVNGHFKMAIYDENFTLMGQTNEIATTISVVYKWYSGTCDIDLVAGNYYLVAWGESGWNPLYFRIASTYNVSATGVICEKTYVPRSNPNFPNPLTNYYDLEQTHNIYATYDPVETREWRIITRWNFNLQTRHWNTINSWNFNLNIRLWQPITQWNFLLRSSSWRIIAHWIFTIGQITNIPILFIGILFFGTIVGIIFYFAVKEK